MKFFHNQMQFIEIKFFSSIDYENSPERFVKKIK